MIQPWNVGASQYHVRSRPQLLVSCVGAGISFPLSRAVQAAVQSYVDYAPWALDEDATRLLRGSHSLVVDTFLQSHDGRHVRYWAQRETKHDCSKAASGLLRRLDHARLLHQGEVRYPVGLVPFL